MSNPPDQVVSIKTLTAQFMKGQVVSFAMPGTVPLSRIANDVASQLGFPLDFQATEKNISNFNFTGSALKLVDRLGTTGGVNAYVDNERLIVKNQQQPLRGVRRILTAQTGMVGYHNPQSRV